MRLDRYIKYRKLKKEYNKNIKNHIDYELLVNERSLLDSDNFNLEDFYRNKEDNKPSKAAVAIITKNNVYESFAPTTHGEMAELMCKYIVSELMNVDFNSNLDTSWQDKISEKDCICIQYCDNSINIINLPDTINGFQYNKLIEINNLFKKYNVENEVSSNYQNSEGDLSLNNVLDELNIRNSKIK